MSVFCRRSESDIWLGKMRRLTYLSKTKYITNCRAPVLTHNLESGIVTIFYSKGLEPLKFWSKNVSDGCIKRTTSESIEGLVTEITSRAFCQTYISLPQHPMQKIGTSMPVLNLVLEYLNRPFCFEIDVRDSQNIKRRFRLSTCQTQNKVNSLLCHMPLKLSSGWNKIQIDLLALTKWSYDSHYVELLRLQIYANCRLRWAYFSDKKYEEVELPEEFRLRVQRPRYIPEKLGQDVP